MFARNFPQLRDVRGVIANEDMQRFVSQRQSRFPNIQRSRSLVGCLRRGSTAGKAAAGVAEAGVAVLGDAAHAFPPDLGQGVNSALEDVVLLREALDAAEAAGGGLHDALRRYEAARDEDVSALMKLMVVGGPYQYGQHRGWSAVWRANQVLRLGLSKLAPNVFSPQIFTCIGKDLRYSEVLESVNETTRRIWMLVGMLGAAFVAVAFARSLA